MGTDQTSHQTPILSLTGISKQFPGVRALDAVDFGLLAGEVHALMGENGAGKSTLINIISGLLHPTSGQIFLAGREVVFANAVQAQRAGISTITQEFNLVPQLTVAENIFLGREPTRRIGLLNWPKIKRHASEVLNELGLNVALGQRVEGFRRTALLLWRQADFRCGLAADFFVAVSVACFLPVIGISISF